MGCQDTPLDTPLRALRQGDAADSASSGVVFVLINGLFDGGISGAVRTHLRERFPACRFLSLHCGAVSSVRDRAVECFWQLKGGIVDYQVDGVELEAGHGRFGEQYVGLLPAWSDSHPIHILAYSLGAPTARYLQHLLERQAFCDENGAALETSGAWVRSVVTFHGANDGTLAVHLVGLSPWSLKPMPLSILWWIFTVIYCIVWLDIGVLNAASGLRLRHWRAQRRKSRVDTGVMSGHKAILYPCSRLAPLGDTHTDLSSDGAGGISLARLLWWRPGRSDNAGRDLSAKRMRELNAVLAQTLPHRSTRYIACYASAFAPLPRVPQPQRGACGSAGQRWRCGGLHLPCHNLLLNFPWVLIVLPLGAIQSVCGMLQRLLVHCARWLEAKGGVGGEACEPTLTLKQLAARTHALDAGMSRVSVWWLRAQRWWHWLWERVAERVATLCAASALALVDPEEIQRVGADFGGAWNDVEGNDGLLSVKAQKAPAAECAGEGARDFASLSQLRAALLAGGEASGSRRLQRAGKGEWVNVWIGGWHDHIAATQDGSWQRCFLEGVCDLLLCLECESLAPQGRGLLCNSDPLANTSCADVTAEQSRHQEHQTPFRHVQQGPLTTQRQGSDN